MNNTIKDALTQALACIKHSDGYKTGNPAYEQAECSLIAALASLTTKPEVSAVDVELPHNGALYDSQWVSIVNAPAVLDAIDKEEAVVAAIKLAEEAFRKNLSAVLAKQSGQSETVPAEWRAAVQEFVDRCDAGEVRSKATYAKFKALLATTPQPPPVAQPVNAELVRELFGKYWDLAYCEGKEGVNLADEANKLLHELSVALSRTQAAQPQQKEGV